MGWFDAVKNFGKGAVFGLVPGAINAATGGALGDKVFGDPGADAERQRKAMLYGQAELAGRFANQSQGNYNNLTNAGNYSLQQLRKTANGENSVSAEQLRQGLQQNQAAQTSFAAGGRPGDAAMRARTAAIQMGRQGAGLAGQQAIAGLQERNQAQQQYAGLLQGLRGQDLQASLGSRQNAMSGYGAGNAGAPEKSWLEKYGPAIQGAASSAAAMSDERTKTAMRPGDGKAMRAAEGLDAHSYRYRDPGYGQGDQLGPTAQGLERAGLGHTVINTPAGKMVDGAKLALVNTAMASAMARRLSELERKRR
jgi:hypothetical protein